VRPLVTRDQRTGCLASILGKVIEFHMRSVQNRNCC
jgi:hypothetical protein